MRTGLVEGIMAQLWLSFAYGTVITGLALLLGASSFELGVMGALPVLGSLVQVPAAIWLEHSRNRRKMAIIGSLGRLLWLVPALVIFLPIPTGMKLTAFLLAIVTGQLMLGIANNAWLDWMTDLIPAEVRGRYFGTRMMLMNAVALVVGLGGASLVDWSKRSGLEAWAYALLLTLAAFGGGLASFLLTKQPEPSIQHPATCGARDLLLMPLRHVDFRKFAGTFVIFQFGLGLGAPFFIAYALEVLGYPLRVVALLDATIAVFGMLAQTQWGKLADRIRPAASAAHLYAFGCSASTVLVGCLTGAHLAALHRQCLGWYRMVRHGDGADQPADGAGTMRGPVFIHGDVLCGDRRSLHARRAWGRYG
jgi:hypothetical protein